MPERAQRDLASSESSVTSDPLKGPGADALQRSSSAALDRMIGAADPLVAELPKDTHPFEPFVGHAFAGGADGQSDVAPSDVKQGELGDCWLTAAMAAIARADPASIKRLINERGDGTYDVTIYVPTRGSKTKQAHVVTIDNRAPVSNGKPIYGHSQQAGELWPMLLEKAYATWAGAYGPLNAGKDSGAGLEVLTADPVETHLMMFRSKPRILEDLATAFAEHRPVVLASKTPTHGDLDRAIALNLVWPHGYALENVDSAAKTVTVRNSARDDSELTPTVTTLTIDELDRFFAQYAIGPKL